MTDIRPLGRGDLPAVTKLLGEHLPSDLRPDQAFLKATLLDHPWADPELPSLVATDGGVVVGFIGAQARRMRLDDRALRAVCCSHLVVAPGNRTGAAGALLLKRLMAGPQDVTWSDTANPTVTRMWRLFGGHCDYMRGCDWMLALRPARWARSAALSLARGHRSRAQLLPVKALPLRAARPRPATIAVSGAAISSGIARTGEIVEHGALFADARSIRPDHDRAYLEHVFALVERMLGALTRRIVLRDDRPIGWYAYADRQAGGGRVLHLAAREADMDAVLEDLVEHARGAGRTLLSGRLEPHMEEALRSRSAVLAIARRPVIHARDEQVRALLARGSALITQLDGEWFVD